ncbi:MAG: TetR family transcriptional regulator [Acidimicrobiales bacterium]|nr:TetR family transcriptional regulator [Acidimicrobiales bacterium]
MPAGLRDRKKARTRDALVRSALDQFTERGFDGVTVEEIAAACDVSPRTFFRYFASKEDVLFVGVDEAQQRLLAGVRAQPVDTPLIEALRTAVLDVAAEYDDEDERSRLLRRHQVVRASEALQGRAAERYHRWSDDVIAEVRATGRADTMSELDLRLAVAATATALAVATALWVDGGGRGDLTALLTTVLDRLREGLDF